MTTQHPTTPQVSVVLPLFGGHRAAQTLGTVVRAWLAQDVPCEVVVAAAGDVPVRLPPETGQRARVLRVDAAVASPGPLRNVAAADARAPVLYLGDADIVPMGTGFLGQALRLRGADVVVQPWMYRLVNAAELTEVAAWQPPGRGRVCFVTGDRTGRLVPVPGEQFRWELSELMVDPPPDLVDGDDSAELVRRSTFHWGGVLVERRLFELVGGYCPSYTGWGCEDDDLRVKLAGRATLIPAWRAARTLTCLHFEHPRPYAGPALAANRRLLAQRVAAGAEAMISDDASLLPR